MKRSKIVIGNKEIEPISYMKFKGYNEQEFMDSFIVPVKGDCMNCTKHQISHGSKLLMRPLRNAVDLYNHIGEIIGIVIDGKPYVKELSSIDPIKGIVTLKSYLPQPTVFDVAMKHIQQIFIVQRVFRSGDRETEEVEYLSPMAYPTIKKPL